MTPTIVWGVRRNRLSSASLFTQPLNWALLTAAWGAWHTRGQVLGLLGRGPWSGWAGGCVGGLGRESPHREPVAVLAAKRKTPHKEGVGLGGLQPPVPLVRLLPALGPDPVHTQLDPGLVPPQGHLGVGRGT